MPENWIDPFDMSPSKDYLQYSDSLTPLHAQHLDGNADTEPNQKLFDLYFRRTINMLLNSVHEDYIEPDVYSGHLFFKIDAEKYELLKSFADGTTKEDLAKIDKVLGEILNKPTSEFLQTYLESWIHKCLNIVLSREGIACIIILSYAIVIFKLFHSNLYSIQMFNFVFINFLLFDFVFTWIHLYQKATSEYLAKRHQTQTVPEHCNPGEMNFFHFFAHIFTTEDQCKNYYELNIVDIFYKVTPGTVLTEMFARTVQYPAKSVGRAFGDLVSGVYSSFPWPLNIIILPMCLLFICLLTCIILSTVLGRQMKFNFLYLISFSFGGESSTKQDKDSISGNNLEKLLNMTQNQRQFIENIPVEETREDKKRLEPVEEPILKQIQDKETTEEEPEVETIENTEILASGDHN